MADDGTARERADLASLASASTPSQAAAAHAGGATTDSEATLRRLLVSAAGGSAVAFEGVYTAMSARVFGLAKRITRDSAIAEEVAQEVFVEVWRRAASYDPERGSAVAWVLTLAHRRAVDRVRREQVRRDALAKAAPEPELAPGGPDEIDEAIEATWRASHVRAAVGELSDKQRQAVELAYFHGFTQQQVSDKLGIPLGTAKTRLRDALTKLRGVLEVAP